MVDFLKLALVEPPKIRKLRHFWKMYAAKIIVEDLEINVVTINFVFLPYFFRGGSMN